MATAFAIALNVANPMVKEKVFLVGIHDTQFTGLHWHDDRGH